MFSTTRFELRRRLAGQDGFSLVELLVVLVLIGIIIGALTDIFTSSTNSEVAQNNRIQAQQSVRLGLDQLRREAHCGTNVVSNQNQSPTPNGTYPAQAVTITIGNYCPTWKTGIVSVTWCTATTSTPPNTYILWRYAHTTDMTGSTYAAACANTGSGAVSWARNIVNVGAVTSGQIFTSYSTPTQPAMAPPLFSLAPGSGFGCSSCSPDPIYAYVVDPVTAAGEQPGTEGTVTLTSGTTAGSITVDWTSACPPYAGITSWKIYGRTAGAEQYLTTISEPAGAPCTTTTWVDNNSVSPTAGTTPQPAILAGLSVDVPVRVKASGGTGLAELRDNITLRNTPR